MQAYEALGGSYLSVCNSGSCGAQGGRVYNMTRPSLSRHVDVSRHVDGPDVRRNPSLESTFRSVLHIMLIQAWGNTTFRCRGGPGVA